MKICVINERRRELKRKLPSADIILFPFGTVGEVNYADELAGKSDKLEQLAKLSGAAGCGIFCGCTTDSRGIKRKSVAAAAGGRLLGICDMLNVLDGEDIKGGATIGIYEAAGFKIGICIGQDLYFPECVRPLAMCGCNLITVHTEGVVDHMSPVLIRAYAYLFGTPIVMCSGGCAYFADITGDITSSNQSIAVFETAAKNCYRSVSSRRRGPVCGRADDY